MATLIFFFIEVIVHVRVFIPILAHLIFPTWTYCFDAKPLLLVSRSMISFLKEEAYIVKNKGVEGQSSIGVSWGMTPSFWLTLHLVEPNCTFLFLFYVFVWLSPQFVGAQTLKFRICH